LKIVFFGTPEFAVPSLEAVIEAGYEVVGVVTAPDKPSGRGLQLNESAVKKFAVSKGLKVLQPVKLKDPQFIEELQSLHADLQIVIAFRMMPEIVWNMPPLGTFNLHASLLPQYRGAAPINRAIMNGETYTGLTTFFLKHEIDTGNIVLQEKVEITNDETAGTLHDKMMIAGAALVVKTLDMVNAGEYPLIEQMASEDIKHAPKIFKEDCKIQWTQNALSIYNQIRGLSPYPAAFCLYKNDVFKIYSATIIIEQHSLKPGEFIIEKNMLKIACNDGYILPTEVQAQGKKRMDIKSFLVGFRPDATSFE
jgi:methionyl-tRNA formyltransferase